MNIVGLLLAAGRGRRMGGGKQFHIAATPDGDKPLVAAAFDTIAPVCDDMFVVLGHRANEVAAVLAPRQFEAVTANPDAPMIDSIKAGLQAICSRTATRSGDFSMILLQLGDHPALARTTLDQVFAAAEEHPDQAIIPTYQDNGGHPVLIPSDIANTIIAIPSSGSLRQFWLEHLELCKRLEVDDPGVIQNINTIEL